MTNYKAMEGCAKVHQIGGVLGSSKDRVNQGTVEPTWYEIHDENSIECGDHM
jgi:hypothetical protein